MATKKILADLELDGSITSSTFNIGNSDNYIRESSGDVELYGDASVVIESGDGVIIEISDVLYIDGSVESNGSIQGASFVKTGGTSSQFLKADGSVDSSTYLTSGDVTSSQWDAATGGINYAGGSVGINTTTPQSKLHVKSSNSGASTHSGTLIVEAGSAPSIQILSANTQTQSIKFGDAQDGDAGAITYSHGANEMQFRVNGGSKMTIDSDGNVGVGITNPTGKLELDGGDFIINNDHLIKSKNASNYIDIYKAADASMRFKMGHATVGRFQFLNNADTEVFTIDARNERVGIGRTSPDVMLDISTSTYANAFVPIQDLKYSTFDVMKLGYTGLTGSIRKGTIDTATYGFSINTGDGSERLAIDTSGDVVIGGNTTSASFIKSGGASTEFLKADGSVDTNTYLTSADISGDYLLNTTDTLTGRLTVTSSVRVGDDTAAATSANVGALRYREETGFSYVDMCMKTDNSSWGWVNIVKNIFSV